MVYPALLPLMRTPRLPLVDWTDAPRRFKWTRPFRRKTKSVFLRVCHHISNAVYIYWPQGFKKFTKEDLTLPTLQAPLFFKMDIVVYRSKYYIRSFESQEKVGGMQQCQFHACVSNRKPFKAYSRSRFDTSVTISDYRPTNGHRTIILMCCHGQTLRVSDTQSVMAKKPTPPAGAVWIYILRRNWVVLGEVCY